MKKIVINNDVEQFFEGFVNEELFAKIGMGLLIAGIAAVVLGLLNYIFTSLAYVRISKRRGIKAGWLAWFPVLRYYIYGKVANDHDKRNGVDRKWHIAMLVFAVLFAAASVVSAVNEVKFITEATPIIETFEETTTDVQDLYQEAVDVIEDENSFDAIFMQEDYISDVNDIFDNIKSGVEEVTPAFTEYLLKSLVVDSAVLLLGGVLIAMYFVCLYKTFESTAPKATLFCFIISMIIPLAKAICLFACRNKGYEKTDAANASTRVAPAAPAAPVIAAQEPVQTQPIQAEPVQEQPAQAQEVVEQPVAEQEEKEQV